MTVHSLAVKRAARLNIFREQYKEMTFENNQQILDLTMRAAYSMGMSAAYFSRKIKAETGATFLEKLTELRVSNAKKRLLMTGLPVGEIGRSVGYPDSNYFVKVFKRSTGLTPSEYREKNGDEC